MPITCIEYDQDEVLTDGQIEEALHNAEVAQSILEKCHLINDDVAKTVNIADGDQDTTQIHTHINWESIDPILFALAYESEGLLTDNALSIVLHSNNTVSPSIDGDIATENMVQICKHTNWKDNNPALFALACTLEQRFGYTWMISNYSPHNSYHTHYFRIQGRNDYDRLLIDSRKDNRDFVIRIKLNNQFKSIGTYANLNDSRIITDLETHLSPPSS